MKVDARVVLQLQLLDKAHTHDIVLRHEFRFSSQFMIVPCKIV